MLCILRGELIKRGKAPVKAIIEVLGCSEKTARNKLNGRSDFTLPEAIKIQEAFFNSGEYEIKQLFSNTQLQQTGT